MTGRVAAAEERAFSITLGAQGQMTWRGKILGIVLLAIVAALGAAAHFVYKPALPPIAPPDPQNFDKALVAQGQALAAIGDCAVCHTAREDAALAGGRALATPFGTLFSTNITPDAKTGIGRWSEAAFVRAMREGVSRDGTYLYPAFPYDHFTHVDDADLQAIYAYLMTRRPIDSHAPANELRWPYDFRPLLAGWDLLFQHKIPFVADPAQDAEWNRGAYLVEGLGHCGACHTPRNALGAEHAHQAFAGGVIEGWYAPPLNAANPAVEPWTADRLEAYFHTGIDLDHAAAAGPMGPVVHDLAAAPMADRKAIAVYVAWLMRDSPAAIGKRRPPLDRADYAQQEHARGATLFAGACATCHGAGAPMMLQGRPPLEKGSPLQEADPRDTIAIILHGLAPPVDANGPYMPAFADEFSDTEIDEIVAYLRARFSDGPAWADLAHAVASARKEGAS